LEFGSFFSELQKVKTKKLKAKNNFFILIDLWLIIPLIYREWIFFQNTLQTFPKQLPPKTTPKESYVKAMISMDYKGFGLYPLV
jgi:hypothetical protein